MKPIRSITATLTALALCFYASAGLPAEKRGCLLADPSGNLLYSENPDSLLVPASTFKLLTSLAAFHYLGETFRFRTQALLDRDQTLIFRGYGNPLFTSEVIQEFCRDIAFKLKEVNGGRIKGIRLDGTYFDDRITIPGAGGSANPYDAVQGALCANFNTVSFSWDPERSRFISGEPETPLLPFVLPRIREAGVKQGRVILNREESRLYPGMLIRHFLEQEGIEVRGGVEPGTPSADAAPLGTLVPEEDLKTVIRKLMTYSNNFMANQILLVMGAEVYGPPATLGKGVRALQLYTRKLLKPASIRIAEGSGISRLNRITPRAMLHVLETFRPYRYLLTTEGNEWYKTGTLKDVRARAGYFETPGGGLYPFVIMVNQEGQGYTGIRSRFRRMVQEHYNRKTGRGSGNPG